MLPALAPVPAKAELIISLSAEGGRGNSLPAAISARTHATPPSTCRTLEAMCLVSQLGFRSRWHGVHAGGELCRGCSPEGGRTDEARNRSKAWPVSGSRRVRECGCHTQVWPRPHPHPNSEVESNAAHMEDFGSHVPDESDRGVNFRLLWSPNVGQVCLANFGLESVKLWLQTCSKLLQDPCCGTSSMTSGGRGPLFGRC